jgi:nitroimidazol reductase NimA-like FMN-containing flavoprotein (pyridoxamine 5'-phosphate oxidase superfamily)
MSVVMRELSLEECLTRLRDESVGRVAVLDHDVPVVVPVNYQLVEVAGIVWIVLRTRPGNLIDTAPMKVGFEIDGIDLVRESGWSVLVRGTLHHVDVTGADFRERFDPHPWLGEDRSAWLVIQPFSITGRTLEGPQPTWVFVGTELFLG